MIDSNLIPRGRDVIFRSIGATVLVAGVIAAIPGWSSWFALSLPVGLVWALGEIFRASRAVDREWRCIEQRWAALEVSRATRQQTGSWPWGQKPGRYMVDPAGNLAGPLSDPEGWIAAHRSNIDGA